MNEDGLVDRIARSRFECVLDPALGENVIAGRAFVDGDTSRERPALAQAPNGNDACRHQKLEKRATLLWSGSHALRHRSFNMSGHRSRL